MVAKALDQVPFKARVTRTGKNKQYASISLPRHWIDWVEREFGKPLTTVEIMTNQDELVVRYIPEVE